MSLPRDRECRAKENPKGWKKTRSPWTQINPRKRVIQEIREDRGK